jgi:hypothetical protein
MSDVFIKLPDFSRGDDVNEYLNTCRELLIAKKVPEDAINVILNKVEMEMRENYSQPLH